MAIVEFFIYALNFSLHLSLSNLRSSDIRDCLFQSRGIEANRCHCQHRKRCPARSRRNQVCIALPHVVSRPIHGKFVLRAENTGIVRRIFRKIGRGCVIFPEGQVDEGETAPGKHGYTVFALVAGFMSLGIRVMLLRLEGKHSLQG